MKNKVTKQDYSGFYALVWQRFKNHKLAFYSLFMLATLVFFALFAPFFTWLLGVSPTAARLSDINLGPSWPHLLGTNELGQDVFARLIYGGRVSLSVGFISALTSALIGTTVGLVAGFYGGKIDAVLMRITDAMLSVPILPLMIVFAGLDLSMLGSSMSLLQAIWLGVATFVFYGLMRLFLDDRARKKGRLYRWYLVRDGIIVSLSLMFAAWLFFEVVPWKSFGEGNFSSVIKLIFIIVLFGWMTVARLARASALQLKSRDFVLAAQALGASNSRILWSHIFPNALAPIVVAATLEVGSNILYEAALSFLGLGIQPPVSSWGNMLNNAVDYIKITPSLAFWPGFFILITVASFNFLGDGMRDALDPHQVLKNAP